MLEIAGVVCIAVGLALIYPPLMWIWLGVVSFAASWALELQARGHKAADVPAPIAAEPLPDEGSDDAQPFGTGETAVYAR